MNKKTSFLLGIAMVLIIPQITLAAWWNPGTWFESRLVPTQNTDNSAELLKRIQELETKVDTEKSVTVTKPVIIKTPETAKPQQTITKTIQVDNPELQSKINLLAAENTRLKSEVGLLTSTLTQCQNNEKTTGSGTSKYSEKLKEIAVSLAKLKQLRPRMDILENLSFSNAYKEAVQIQSFKNIDDHEIFPIINGDDAVSVISWIRVARLIIEKEIGKLEVLQAQYQSY